MTTTTEDAYATIRNLLSTGQFAAGQKVSQLKLARRLGCSTVPVAEAMRRLESDGLLQKEPRKMARVRELSRSDLEGLYLVREALEGVAAGLAAQRMTETERLELQALGDAFESAAATKDQVRLGELEIAIHRHVAAAARCDLLADELSRLLLIERTAGCTAVERPMADDFSIRHRAFIRAIVDRDAHSAEYLMRFHIREGLKDALADRGESL